MRFVRRSAPRLLTLTAMLLPLGSIGVGAGLVLCFGGDGHVAIEGRGPQGCAEGGQAGSSTASGIAVPISSSHCGACVDVALDASSATEGGATAKRQGTNPATIPIAALRLPTPLLRVAISHRYSTRFISARPHTVVIRC